ncbi:MAG TPA: peroxidase family protein [Bryobacteraceae bacterium]
MKALKIVLLCCAVVLLDGCIAGFRPIASRRADRYQAKVDSQSLARSRGGQPAVDGMTLPWVDWSNYYGTSDASRGVAPGAFWFSSASRGVQGALLDLEIQRLELIKFNLLDNNGTYRKYVLDPDGAAAKTWPEMRLPKDHPNYQEAGGDAAQQICTGELIRKRTLTGICNDQLNPLMGSTGQLFGRNVEFDTSFPDLGQNTLTRNRHGDRLGLLRPDPQVISRRLFTRRQEHPETCREGYGAADPSQSNCDYQKASSFNVLAAFWVQFMTHDWFSHLEEGHNDNEYIKTGCESQRVNNVEQPLSPDDIQRLGCRPDDRIDRSYVAQSTPPGTFSSGGKEYLERAPKTMRNTTTAWWDASQMYGYDETSGKRVKRDPQDRAKLLQVPLAGASTAQGLYLPLFETGDPINPEWAGQEATAFPDNWSIGLSFLTNVFAREHNAFVDEFRKQAAHAPDADSGLRNPAAPAKVIRNRDVSSDELYDAARLVVAAEIAKIHTTEWTPQLLYDETGYVALNGNWSGLLGTRAPVLTKILQDIVKNGFGKSKNPLDATQWYTIFAAGPGIVGLGSLDSDWDITKPGSVNGGVNHFGSPFNFPEEFISVYRLHPLVPDLIEYRDLKGDPNKIAARLPVVETFRGKATEAMHSRGLANWGLSIGRQRVGLLTLRNYPMFLQNLKMDRLESTTKQIDVAALDLIRDREHGTPRFNEFRRQYGLRQLTSFDDFLDPSAKLSAGDRQEQQDRVKTMREIYGQHVCDISKQITDAQVNADGSAITDCLGKPNGTLVDNIEDVDLVVGLLAEPVRPHGFAISETQFVVFIINASRRLFSDRFLTSSFRPEFYTTLGLDWVNNNGPGKPRMEKGKPNGHEQQEVLPFKRVLMRTIPELGAELENVVNAFDPWARSRGKYYSLDWTPRAGAESDDAFRK